MALGGRVLGGQALAHEFFGGAAASVLAPFSFPTAIGDVPFQIDYTFASDFKYGTYPMFRDQADDSNRPGTQSLSRDGLWRQAGVSWHLGAGQKVYDRPDASEFRFDNSIGVDIWTKYRLSLLPATDQKLSSANTNLYQAVAGTDYYVLDGANLKRSTNMDVDTPTLTALTGTPPANNGTSIASDGNFVWTTHQASGTWRTTRGTAAWAAAAHLTTALGANGKVFFVRGRVIIINNNAIYDATTVAYGAGGVGLPAALFTNSNTDFKFTSVAEGRNAIYAAGYSGDKSLIYRIHLKDDGTGLDQPIVCAEFDGANDQIETLYGYLGPFLFIGQAKGWRFANIHDNGDLTVGARAPTTSAVLCFEGQENFVWFGWTNYLDSPGQNGTHTGLGRLNIQEFGQPDQLVPAYASDLMVQSQTSAVLSVVTFQNKRFFTVSGVGIYGQHHSTNLFANGGTDTGILETGDISFNLYEPMIALFVDIDVTLVTAGAIFALSFRADADPFVDLGFQVNSEQDMYDVGQSKGKKFALRLSLGNVFVPSADVQFRSWILRMQPAPSHTTYWKIPALISNVVLDDDGNEHYFDPFEILDYINMLHHEKEVTTLRLGGRGYTVVVEDCEWQIHKMVDLEQGVGFNGTALIECKVLGE